MSLYPQVDQELLLAFRSFSKGKTSIGSLVSLLQSSMHVVRSIEDKKLRVALQIAEGDIDILIAMKYGADGFEKMHTMYNDSPIFMEIMKIIAPIRQLLEETNKEQKNYSPSIYSSLEEELEEYLCIGEEIEKERTSDIHNG
jgi:hypothetical protein